MKYASFNSPSPFSGNLNNMADSSKGEGAGG